MKVDKIIQDLEKISHEITMIFNGEPDENEMVLLDDAWFSVQEAVKNLKNLQILECKL